MYWHTAQLTVPTRGKGFLDITDGVNQIIAQKAIRAGFCILFIPHSSASLVIQENCDPTAKRDLEQFLERIAPEDQPWMEHTLEGCDDSSAHLRAMLLPTSLTIPVEFGRLALGTWQGVYLVEHRRAAHQRRVSIRLLGVD